MTGAYLQHLRLNLMEPLGPCLKARPLVEEVSSTPCAGIGAEPMTMTRGSRLGTQDGDGKACCHTSERSSIQYPISMAQADRPIQSETYTPVPSEEIAREYSINYTPGAHGSDGPVQVSYPRYFYPQSGEEYPSRIMYHFPDVLSEPVRCNEQPWHSYPVRPQ